MKIKTLFIVLLLVMITPALADKSEEAVRSAIQHQVSLRHPSVPNNFWENLGSDAVPVMKKMYIENNSAAEKSFLIEGFSHFSDPSVSALLREEVANTQNEVFKKKLLSAVIQSEGESAFEFVEPYLKDEDAHIRLSVARGLLAFDKNEAIQKRLAEFKAKEKTSWVLTDLNKKEPTEKVQKTRSQMEGRISKGASAIKPIVVAAKVIPPLPEKSWAGIWRGSYITENKMILVEANLVLLDATSSPMKWKVEYKLPKNVKQEWKNGEFTLNYFQTNRAHWMEIRNAKLDIVFLAQRKVK